MIAPGTAPQAFLQELVGRWAKCKAPTAPPPALRHMDGVHVGLVVSIAHGAISGKLHAIVGVPNGHSIGPTRFAPQQFAPRPFAILGVGGLKYSNKKRS